MEAEFLLH